MLADKTNPFNLTDISSSGSEYIRVLNLVITLSAAILAIGATVSTGFFLQEAMAVDNFEYVKIAILNDRWYLMGKMVVLVGLICIPFAKPRICSKLGYTSEIHRKIKCEISFAFIFSVTQSFWHFVQSTVVILPCSVQKFKTIGPLKRMLWANEISRLRRVSKWYPWLQPNPGVLGAVRLRVAALGGTSSSRGWARALACVLHYPYDPATPARNTILSFPLSPTADIPTNTASFYLFNSTHILSTSKFCDQRCFTYMYVGTHRVAWTFTCHLSYTFTKPNSLQNRHAVNTP